MISNEKYAKDYIEKCFHPSDPSTIPSTFQEVSNIASLQVSLYLEEQDWQYRVLNVQIIWKRNLKLPLVLTQTSPSWDISVLPEV